MLPCILVALLQTAGAEKPEALVRFEGARRAIRYADVTFAGLSPAASDWRADRPFRHRWLLAGEQIAHLRLGTPDGITGIHEDEPVYGAPTGELWDADGSRWDYRLDKVFVHKTPPSADEDGATFDFRSLGMSYRPSELTRRVDRAIGACLPRADYAYEARIVDGLHRVEAQPLQGDGPSVVWHIDPGLGWNAVRCEYRVRGSLVMASRTDYSEVNGVFIPVVCAFLDGEGVTRELFAVESAQVNEPHLPGVLTPEYIGVEPGANVFVAGEPATIYVGHGQTMDPREAFLAERHGQIAFGPKVLARRAGLPIPWTIPDPRAVRTAALDDLRRRAGRPDDAWARYTAEFIARHRLDERRTERALHLLGVCQAERDRYLRTVRGAEQELRAKLADASATAQRDAQERLARLARPVERIFEERLKPGLDELLPQAQRAAR